MINLLPLERKESLYKDKKRRIVIVSLLLLFCVICASIALLVPTYISVLGQKRSTETALERLQSTLSTVGQESYDDVVRSTNEKLSHFFTLDHEPVPQTEVIQILLAALPPGIAVTTMSFSSTLPPNTEATSYIVSLSGISSNREVLQKAIDALKSVPGVHSADLPISNFTQSTQIPFNITIDF